MAGLARCKDGDPQRGVEALLPAEKPHLHLFIATSDIHLKHKLKMSREEALAAAVKWVSYARKRLGPDAEIEFSAEDASRTEHEFLLRVYEAVVDAGATTVNIPDTVGYAIPAEFGELTTKVVDRVGSGAVISVHCHNDLGLATANTLAAVQAGARQVEVTINGLGERAGNASLEEVVMALRTRPTEFQVAGHGINTEQISNASRLVSYLTGFTVQPNKAIVGRNAFAHESGIHQDGVLKNALTYEIMTPQSVGLAGSRLSVGKLSGRRGLQGKLAELGYDLEGEALDGVYAPGHRPRRYQEGGHRRRPHRPGRGAGAPARSSGSAWRLARCSWSTGPSAPARAAWPRVPSPFSSTARPPRRWLRATVPSMPSSWPSTRPSSRSSAGIPSLAEYEIRAVSGGEDAQGQVMVRARRSIDREDTADTVNGHGLSTNIIEASLEAYLAGLEKLLWHEADRRPPTPGRSPDA